jgi:hypothetical protein
MHLVFMASNIYLNCKWRMTMTIGQLREKIVVSVTRFGTMGTKTPGLGREEQGGPTMSWPTRPKDTGQEAHRGGLETFIEKSCKLGK